MTMYLVLSFISQ